VYLLIFEIKISSNKPIIILETDVEQSTFALKVLICSRLSRQVNAPVGRGVLDEDVPECQGENTLVYTACVSLFANPRWPSARQEEAHTRNRIC
jgi:hypothetical protein